MEANNHPSEGSDVRRAESSLEGLGRTNFLARAVRSGSRESFAELFERVMPALDLWTRFRTRRTGGASPEAQDVLQEVWLRAWGAFGSYDGTRSFRAWILGIAKHVVLESVRRSGGSARQARDRSGIIEDVPDSVTSFGQRLARDESLERLVAFVDTLEPEERSLVLYCGIEERTGAEAGERLGISAEAASQRWLRLRARMRENPRLAGLAADLFE
jgi:RNA polymerase sigma-70 factor (ECF subfamily)